MIKDKRVFNQSDLVLNVSNKYNPMKLDLDEWEMYLDVLCGGRDYQKEAIKTAIIFLASGEYKDTKDLVIENYNNNSNLQLKYPTINDYLNSLQINNKLSANIDLATGTGKSYLMFGIAQIMLGIGLVNRVLVLCPSLTIEKGLTDKFLNLSSSVELTNSIPDSAVIRNPRIIDASNTILKGDVCIENIHAVYETTGSSIDDSFRDGGNDTLVLNDESHHIFNKLQGIHGASIEGQGLKKWKSFLVNPKNDFKYIIGVTGTAYFENEYFNDVIYRYSLRQAIEQKIVKSIDYVQKDDSSGRTYEKFQKIYQNHEKSKAKYSRIKPLTILITKDINNAKHLKSNLIEFISDWEAKPREEVEKKVLIVTSHKEHANNTPMLDYVDDKDNPIEWIVSVSMLTEGWDVKNVFQIVPWEDRAFNSKLLIAQVLGRGLRLPPEYQNPQPSVIVFNHDSWSRNIKQLVDEVLEIETRVISTVKYEGDRNIHNFVIHNLSYEKIEKEVVYDETIKPLDYSKTWREGIKLSSQTNEMDKYTTYESIVGGKISQRSYAIHHIKIHINDIVEKIIREFKMRDWEGGVLGLGDNEVYSRINLPPKEKIRDIITTSMKKVGITGDYLIEENAQRVYKAFQTLFRKRSKNIIQQSKYSVPFSINTEEMASTSSGLSYFRNDTTFFYSDDYKEVISNTEQAEIIPKFIEDEGFTIKSKKEVNQHLFKTPSNFVITNKTPERNFVMELCKKENVPNYTSWIKSRDSGFYSIEYTYRINSHQRQRSFNPDFFIQCNLESEKVYLVVEIKADGDVSIENKAKYKYGKEHFHQLNLKLANLNKKERYIFHFLSPKDYHVFFKYLDDGRLFESQSNFRCDLENLLESKL